MTAPASPGPSGQSAGFLITETSLKGQMARHAVQQHPYNKPPRLDDVTQQIEDACAKSDWDEASLPEFRCKYFTDARELLTWLKTVFPDDHEIMKLWNSRRNGNTAEFGFVSRYWSPAKDDDFIDIDALLGNVARGCIQEAQEP